MSEILVIDVDAKQDNLYLMQLSAYHKARGDIVFLQERSDPDKVYISCLFKKNRAKALGIATTFSPNVEIEVGGTGINYSAGNLEISKLKPDYDLYPSKKALGRTTYGCIRKCPWCCVPEKEGRFIRWQHISEFYNDKFDTVWLLDNNILADQEWFFENTNFILEHSLKLQEGGMDIRLLTPEIADRLREIKFDGMLHFAWDRMRDEDEVLKGIEMLKSAGFNTRSEISIFVMINYDTTREEDLYRCSVLRDLNTNPFIMIFQDRGKANRWHKNLARHVNRKAIFWSDTWKVGISYGCNE